MTGPARHVIFGTGAIGLATLDALLRRGETVRMVNRSGSAPIPDEVDIVGGNAADPQFTIDVTRGAQVVYQTLNPPYARWVEEFPGLQTGVLAAAKPRRPAGQHGKRLRVRSPGRPAPHRNPRLRSAHQEGATPRPDGQRAARRPPSRQRIGRDRTCLGLLRAPRRRAIQPRRPVVPRRPGREDRQPPRQPRPAPHLHLHPRHRRRPSRPRRASRSAGTGVAPTQRPRHPHDPRTGRYRLQAGRSTPDPARGMPPLLLRLAALTNPTLRELLEMQYQFEEPFIVESSKITTIGATATPSEQPWPTPSPATAHGQHRLPRPAHPRASRTPLTHERASRGRRRRSVPPPSPPAEEALLLAPARHPRVGRRLVLTVLAVVVLVAALLVFRDWTV